VFQVRRAVHIRTGQPAAAEAIDAWLSDHDVEVLACADVYEACVHLLREYHNVPEMVVIGTDWLAPDELAIVRYARETWPRAAIVVYGAGASPAPEASPLTIACGSDAALRTVLADSPAQLLERLCLRTVTVPADDLLPTRAATPTPEYGPVFPPLRPTPAGAPTVTRSPDGSRTRVSAPGCAPPDCDRRASRGRGALATRPPLTLSSTDAARSILTAEELSALLDTPSRG